MRRRLLPAVLLLALAAAGPAAAQVTVLEDTAAGPQAVVPGITYERRAQDAQVLHVIRAAPSARTRLEAITTGPNVMSRGDLGTAVRQRLAGGVVAGVNGDFFNYDYGYPSGVLVRGQELQSDPEPGRSTLVIPDPGGRIALAKLEMASTWQAVVTPPARASVRTIQGVNRPAARSTETILFTPAGTTVTPTGDSLLEARIRLDDPSPPLLGQVRTGTVVGRRSGGGSEVGQGHVVLTGVGSAGKRISDDLPLGQRITFTMGLAGWPVGATAALGGGPALVTGGLPVLAPDETFLSSQLAGRTARTAVGQTADGTLLLVSADGPEQGSAGLTNSELATTLAGLGAVEALAMDSGGSTQMRVLTTPVVTWSSYRQIGTALTLAYSGVQLQPLPTRLTPNSDGVLERVSAIVRSPIAGTATVTARRRGGGGSVRLGEVPVGPGAARVNLDPRAKRMRDGVWEVRARLVPADGDRPTAQTRRLIVDRTLGGLTATRVVRTVGGRSRPVIRVGFRLASPATVTVRVSTAAGSETLVSGSRLTAGRRALVWDRTIAGKVVGGTATVEVVAVGRLGRTGLSRPVVLPPVKATPRG